MGDELQTARLTIRELTGEDLERVLEVYVSNPAYLELTEGSGGEPGRYDLGMLERDFAVARMTPGRRVAGLFLEGSDEPVGILDWMDQNPSDGKPWIGLLIVRADRQREGFASEAFEGLAERLRGSGAGAVRAAIAARNAAGCELARSLGFEEVERKTGRMASEEEVIVFERSL